MTFRKLLAELNIYRQCRLYGLSLWQCPQFLFFVMGIFIIVTTVLTYLIGTRYIAALEIVVLIVLIITAVLFIITFIITRSFERLAEASYMKSEFINIVSHQLRAPLTNIKWAFEFLMSKGLQESVAKQEEYLSNVKENIVRMVELLDDLLFVSKIEQGTFPFRKQEFSLEDLIKELILRFQVFSEASNIQLKFYPQRNLPKIFADPSLVKLVLENLIDNAIRYTTGGGKVELYLQRKEKELFFKIKDSGVGIPERDQKYIFQKFFRGENIITKQTRGSGLGLYITKSIIEKSKGKIWFESKESKGTTFYFTLPLK